MAQLPVDGKELLDAVLFTVGGKPVTTASLVAGLVILIASVWLAGWMRRTIDRVLTSRGGPPGASGRLAGMIYYVLLISGFGMALSTVGIDFSTLFAAGAIFAVGIGFAMQSIAQNFVAGVILIMERTIKPGDLLEVEGAIVRVLEMGIRASIVQTRDGEDLIIPNSILIQTSIKNFTLRDRSLRIRAQVGVVYSSDMAEVKEILTAVSTRLSNKWSATDRQAQVLLADFGDNSVVWETAVWIDDPWEFRPAMSDLKESIWWAFQERHITIAFPQLDVHFDPEVAEPLRAIAGRAA